MDRFIKKLVIFGGLAFLLFNGIFFSLILPLDTSGVHTLAPEKKVLILGNSQPESVFHNNYLDSVHNFAKRGEPYFYASLKTKEILERNHQVKHAFIQYSYTDVSHERNEWLTQPSFYSRYAKAMTFDDFQFLFRNLNIDLFKIHYILSLPRMARNLFLYFRGKLGPEYGGYVAWPSGEFSEEPDFDESSFQMEDVNENHLLSLMQLIQTLKDNNVQVYLFSTPLHSIIKDEKSAELFDQTLKKEFPDVPYLTFQGFPLENADFSDPFHLTESGAQKFSLFFNGLINEGSLEELLTQEKIDRAISEVRINDIN